MGWHQRTAIAGRSAAAPSIRRTLSASLAIACLLAACGGDDEDDTAATENTAASPATAGNEPSEELTEITIGLAQIVGAATIPLAVQEGYFEDEGLDVELNMTIANPAIAAAVVSGDIQAGMSAWAATSSFITQGLPLRVAIGLSTYGDGTGSTDAGLKLVSLADGGLTSATELEGKTVLLNSLGTDPEAAVRAIAINADVDPDSINLQTVDLPEMGAALRAGRADAALMSEPFATLLAEEAELTVLGSYADLQPSRPGLNLVVSADYAEDNPEIVAGIQRALTRAAEYANDNPDAIRAILAEQYGFPPNVSDKVPLPLFDPFPDPEAIQAVPQRLADVGLIDEVPDMLAIVLPPPD